MPQQGQQQQQQQQPKLKVGGANIAAAPPVGAAPGRSLPFFCKVCNVDLQGVDSFKQHIAGRKHHAVVDALSKGSARATSRPSPSPAKAKPSPV